MSKLTNDNEAARQNALEARMDKLLGAEGLDLPPPEREKYIAQSLGVSGLTGGWRTSANVRRVIDAAAALLRARDEG